MIKLIESASEAREWVKSYVVRAIPNVDLDTEYRRALDLQLTKPKQGDGYEAIHYIKGRSFSAVLDLFGTIARWHPANPNRPSIVARLNDTYQSTNARALNGVGNLSDSFLAAIKNDQLIALVGNRGSGKTAFANHWLNNNTKTVLETELRLSWFRIDAHKVYNLWFDENVDGKKLSLIEYFKVHAAYVMLVYGGRVPSLIRDSHSTSSQFVDLLEWLDENKFGDLFSPSVNEIVDWLKIQITKSNKHGDYSEQIIREIVTNTSMRRVFTELYDFLQGELLERSIGLLCILDGLDNISWSRGNDQYFRMCSQVGLLRDFVLNQTGSKPGITAKMVLAVRPETLPDIPSIDYYYHEQGFKIGSFRCLQIEPPMFQSVLDKKCVALKTSKSFDLERAACHQTVSEETDDPGQYLNTQISSISDYASEFVSTLESSIRVIVKNAVILRGLKKSGVRTLFYNGWGARKEALVEILFNKNCRAFVDGFIKILMVLEAADGLNIKRARQKSRLLQYLLLNGRLYVDSRQYETQKDFRKKINRGEYFPNFFWFNTQLAKADHSVWHGMVSLRIVQICMTRDFLAEEVISILNAIFGYQPECIEDRIEALIAFGLLTSEKSVQKKNRFSTEPIASKWGIQLGVTERAKILLDILFADPDWLYFMALDTPIPSAFSGSSNHIRPHIDPESRSFLNHFFDAYCITLPTMVRVVKHFECSEKYRLNEFMSSTETNDSYVLKGIMNTFKNGETLTNAFLLPQNWEVTFIRAVEKALIARGDDDLAGLRILLADMKGAFVS